MSDVSQYLRELFEHVQGEEFVWDDVKHKCPKGIRFFSARGYLEKTGRTSNGANVWKIRDSLVKRMSRLREGKKHDEGDR